MITLLARLIVNGGYPVSSVLTDEARLRSDASDLIFEAIVLEHMKHLYIAPYLYTAACYLRDRRTQKTRADCINPLSLRGQADVER